MLVALKQRIAPTDQARETELINKYSKLKKAPKAQNISWLQDWEKIYTECKELNLPDVDKHRSLFDFLHAAASVAPEFASVWRISIQKKQAAGKGLPDLYKLIESFRSDRRQANAHSKMGGSHSAFAASFQGKSPENSDSATTVTDKGKKPCLWSSTSGTVPTLLNRFGQKTGNRI